MSLRAEIDLARGAHRIVAALQVGADETIALVGPNGAGKSSCLAAIAGIERLDGGRIVLHEDVLDGGPGGPFVPPERRNIGVVFQDPLLFPGMSARDNVAYGPVSAGRPRSEARAIAGQWLGRVGIDERHAGARPSALSGGQAQRVALARALASSPRALILDEPLAAVDASARLALRRTLREHLTGFEGPRVVVAHDIADAIALADRIVVLEAGRVVQAGTALELAARPASPYVADLVGLNGLAGRARGRVVEVGTTTLTTADEAEGDVLVTIPPRAVSIYRERPVGSPRNVWRTTVAGIESLPDRARVLLGGDLAIAAEVTHAAIEEMGLATGVEVWAAVKATELRVHPR